MVRAEAEVRGAWHAHARATVHMAFPGPGRNGGNRDMIETCSIQNIAGNCRLGIKAKYTNLSLRLVEFPAHCVFLRATVPQKL